MPEIKTGPFFFPRHPLERKTGPFFFPNKGACEGQCGCASHSGGIILPDAPAIAATPSFGSLQKYRAQELSCSSTDSGDIPTAVRPVHARQVLPERLSQRYMHQMLTQETSRQLAMPVHTRQAVPERLSQTNVHQLLTQETSQQSVRPVHTRQAVPERLSQTNMHRCSLRRHPFRQ